MGTEHKKGLKRVVEEHLDARQIIVSMDFLTRRSGEIDFYYVTDFFKALRAGEIIKVICDIKLGRPSVYAHRFFFDSIAGMELFLLLFRERAKKEAAMIYAYIRVSTEMQSYEGQHFEIKNWCHGRGWTVDRWIQEKVSGTKQLPKRTLGKTLRRMREGDVLVCAELSRLGRNMMMVMSILNTCSQKGIRLYSIKDNFELSDSLNAKIIAFAFSLAAEIERNLISQRTREALAAKKLSGVKLGRPAGPSKERKAFEARKAWILRQRAEGVSLRALACRQGIHPNTLARYLKEMSE